MRRDPGKGRAVKAKQVIRECGLSIAQLARDTGLSDAALRAWQKGKRTPSSESLERLAAGLRGRAERLHHLANGLRASVREAGE